MGDQNSDQAEATTAATSWASAGCRAVAVVAAAANKAQPPAGHWDQNNRDRKPHGYRAVAVRLRRRNHSLLQRLATGPLHSLDHLDAANDMLLARLEIALARMEGRPAPQPLPQSQPQIQTSQPQQARPVILRPQLLFRKPVDNTRTPWKPQLAFKHNKIASANDASYLDEYRHPYAPELHSYNPPPEFLRPQLTTNIRYKSFAETPYEFIDTEAQLNDLLRRLETATEIAVDLEHHSYRSFQGFTCLIQISTDLGEDFIIDALALRDHLHALNAAFTDPNILKVFHGAECDIVWLQRDFGVYVVGLFDTHKATIELDFPNKSLQNLLLKYCKVNTNKSLRLADWRVRPLSPELIEYARSDTHYLLFIWRQLRQELLKMGKGSPDRLLSAFQQSKLVSLKLYVKPTLDESYAYELSRKSKKNFDAKQMQALESLLAWRDEIAREEDESIGYVLPNHMLLHIASELPKETPGILACCCPPPPLVLHHLNFIHQLVNSARVKPVTNPKPKIAIEEVVKPVTSIHIYNHQSLGNYSENSNTLSTLKKLRQLYNLPNKSILSGHEVEQSEPVKMGKSFNFVPPFHRRILVKKYNQFLHMKDEPEANTENTSKDPLPNGNINNNSNAPSGKIINPETNIPPIDTSMTHDSRILFTKVTKTKHNTSVDTDEIPAKKSRLADPEENNFKTFDYKSFDYNTFNKEDSKRNKKYKNNKNKKNKNRQ
ncbi:exosome component Rrp6 [Arctopsyche grandis]|uniref:exosome component Rrp6 n=1 Tax=Arctopsyche grandis TaxID=121162 RepID=UPI00406D901D